MTRLSASEFRQEQLQRCGLDFMNNFPEKVSEYNWNTVGAKISPTTGLNDTNNSDLSNKNINNELLKYIPAPLHSMLKDFDIVRMRQYRIDRIRKELQDANVEFGLFFEPTNIRYITDTPNMQVWTKSLRYRYVLISNDERDPIILYDFKGAVHLSNQLEPKIVAKLI